MAEKEREEKERLDVLLVEKGYSPAREKAKAEIMAGNVFVNGQRVDKAGTQVAASAILEVRSDALPYVSRGGLKLAKAIQEFSLDLKDKTVLDIGSSTGGFVDCALQNGAKKVYSVDVGYGQLAWKLRQDERVVVLEKTNARYLSKKEIPEPVDLVTADVSFISLAKVLLAPLQLLKENGQVVALIKPQFEAGRENVGKKGVVKDQAVHLAVIEAVIGAFTQMGLTVANLSFSPITGPEGNIEYLIRADKGGTAAPVSPKQLVEAAWAFHSK